MKCCGYCREMRCFSFSAVLHNLEIFNFSFTVVRCSSINICEESMKVVTSGVALVHETVIFKAETEAR